MPETFVRSTDYSRQFFGVFSLLALGVFSWPLVAGSGLLEVGFALTLSLVALPVVAVLLSLAADSSLRSVNTLALVGVLAGVAALARVLSTGFGGFELVFVVVILAGRALGARQGFVVGVLAIALSSLVWGGFGPWTAYQMVALGWVGLGAGLLPTSWARKARSWGRAEMVVLAAYGVVASYLFGILMNLWFWPLAVGPETSISLDSGASWGENVASFVLYSLATSTLTWDTVRAITTVVMLLLVGGPALRALRRVYSRD
ncbi:MAG TPA: ECF transporter S component [Pontimonas sp.]|nr:ECF transporter S component [Pontimonas sp.]